MTTSFAKGLFRKAIILSGDGRTLLGPTLSADEAEAIGAEFARSKGIQNSGSATLSALRSLSAQAVMDGLNLLTLFGTKSFTPLYADGRIVTGPVDESYRSGYAAPVPMIIGATEAD